MNEIAATSPQDFVALPRETQLRVALNAAAQAVVGQELMSRFADLPQQDDAQLQFGEDQTLFRHGPSQADDEA